MVVAHFDDSGGRGDKRSHGAALRKCQNFSATTTREQWLWLARINGWLDGRDVTVNRSKVDSKLYA